MSEDALSAPISRRTAMKAVGVGLVAPGLLLAAAADGEAAARKAAKTRYTTWQIVTPFSTVDVAKVAGRKRAFDVTGTSANGKLYLVKVVGVPQVREVPIADFMNALDDANHWPRKGSGRHRVVLTGRNAASGEDEAHAYRLVEGTASEDGNSVRFRVSYDGPVGTAAAMGAGQITDAWSMITAFNGPPRAGAGRQDDGSEELQGVIDGAEIACEVIETILSIL